MLQNIVDVSSLSLLIHPLVLHVPEIIFGRNSISQRHQDHFMQQVGGSSMLILHAFR